MGRRIAALRDLLGLTQEQLVEALEVPGLGRSALSKIESGQQVASVELINTLSERYRVRRDWLLAGEAPINQEGAKPPGELEEALLLLARLDPETRAMVLFLLRQLVKAS